MNTTSNTTHQPSSFVTTDVTAPRRPHMTNAMHCVMPVLVRLPDVERIVGIRRSTIYKMEGQGRFPRRVKLGEFATAWVAAEVHAWANERIAERDRAA